MKQGFRQKSIPFVLASFILYSASGCGPSQSTRHLDKYDDRAYADIATFSFSKDRVYQSAIIALQQKGYVVTLSDPQTGLINGEIQNSIVIPEEQKAAEQSEKPSAGSILIAILGVIFLFGIIAWLVNSSDSSNSSGENDKRERHREPYYSPAEETKILSYRYIVTLNLAPLGMDSTEVVISAVRTELENGSVASSGRIENKYLNYSIFEAIQARLEMEK